MSTGKLCTQFIAQEAEEENNNNVDLEQRRKVKVDMESGELVSEVLVLDLLETAMRSYHPDKAGFILVGFPRDISQAQLFEARFSVSPVAVLVDCSEIELGRTLGQRREGAGSVKRRLKLYREGTLPMLKRLDDEERLRVVDGDAEPEKVIEELREILDNEIIALERKEDLRSTEEMIKELDNEIE